ncbi:outer membrane lipoprotein [Candidatus Kinetoplastibacterium blastocrithidii TCC012E]|uniref:Outer membrane lipoprotein n=1 Tax=Candidatus Kinetoplastidibacterium blastocrithidiae TCC012E TaxID=1208922 RepID=M1MEC4_9PROT|nr:BON domain-containing protein [Candidatus Kinetoplastibacterium blastocrithidii]AFZ83264.1 periplasmic protein [Candidatus Kinetoplastibacterium blastocrithidii (ex Strigomonas culicis)]AGF50080.1 outer membrane lipoprotein [Candidatus Kinetoplastibacterium blastocrithidii TCC012E]
MKNFILILIITTILPGCTPVLIGGTAITTMSIMLDRRTAGAQLEDQIIEMKIKKGIYNYLMNENARILVTSYNRRVLITGETEDVRHISNISRIANSVDNIKLIINQIKVEPASSFRTISYEKWIYSKIKAALINNKNVQSGSISITVDKGTVFLMGLVTRNEGNEAAMTAARIHGIKQVVKLFEHIDKKATNIGSKTLNIR